MIINIVELRNQIKQIKESWETVLPTAITTHPFAEDVSKEIDLIAAMLEGLPDEVEGNGLAWQAAQPHLTALMQHAGVLGHATNMPTWLYTFKTTLLNSLPDSIIAENTKLNFTKTFLAKLKQSETYLGEAYGVKKELESTLKESKNTSEKISEYSAVLQLAIDDSASTSKLYEDSKKIHSGLNGISESIKGDLKKQAQIFEEFENKRDEIANILEGASRIGLAGAFKTRRQNKEASVQAWIFGFVIGIAA